MNIKFELDTHLDYQTIESIYLYAFDIKSHDNLDYLLLDDIKSNINDFGLPSFTVHFLQPMQLLVTKYRRR